MEFSVVILTVWAFARSLLSYVRRKKEDERFARVIDALNQGQAKIESLEGRIHDLERAAYPPQPTPAVEAPKPALFSAPATKAPAPQQPRASHRGPRNPRKYLHQANRSSPSRRQSLRLNL
jgi:hypothetical protein